MKVKVSILVTAVGILRSIDTTAMKLSTSYKVRQVLNESQNAITDFEAKRVSLASKYGTLSEDKSHYLFATDAAKETFQSHMNALMDDEVDIDIKRIPIELLDDYIIIEPSNVPYVEWFVSGLE